MTPYPLTPPLHPHAWKKFEQAQANFMRHLYGGRSRMAQRRRDKWGRAMARWVDRIYQFNQ